MIKKNKKIKQKNCTPSSARRDDDLIGFGSVYRDAGHQVVGVVDSALWQREGEALEQTGQDEQQLWLGNGLPQTRSSSPRKRGPAFLLRLQLTCKTQTQSLPYTHGSV